ncbi:MAG: hypothetical protein OEW16_08425, partial [Gammaproteobacteria bacterium]|nr:hypothetical protein [Gammaproteobacteria bacterium]
MSNGFKNPLIRLLRVLPLAFVWLVAGCGGGAATTQNPVVSPPPPVGYTGPPPASQDVQAFKLNVWD